MPSTDVEEALAHWPQAPQTARPLAAGHINDTYVVGDSEDETGPGRYVLQRLNRAVFPNPHAVMRNLAKIVDHEGGKTLVAPTRCANGERCAVLGNGDVWRLFPWVPSRTFQTLPHEFLTVAGAAFGGFLRRFADFPHRLEAVIDGFHDLGQVLRRFDAVPTQPGINAEAARVDAFRAGFTPGEATCVIHGDCKVNNLLFHPTKDAVTAIVDLDTVMLGDPAWDFGDLVRSAFAGSEETAPAQTLSLTRFERLCAGFADGYGPQFGAGDNAQRFATAPAYMSFMLAVRFLTDHIEGDRYFRVPERGANLRRARSQLDLAERFLAAKPSLERVVERVAARGGGSSERAERP